MHVQCPAWALFEPSYPHSVSGIVSKDVVDEINRKRAEREQLRRARGSNVEEEPHPTGPNLHISLSYKISVKSYMLI